MFLPKASKWKSQSPGERARQGAGKKGLLEGEHKKEVLSIVELGVQGVLGMAVQAHQWGVSWTHTLEQGLPEDTLCPLGRGTELSQPPGSAR